MSLDRESGPIDPVTLRKLEVEQAVTRALTGTAKAIAIYYGTNAFLIPENKEPIRALYKSAREEALKKLGVLDESGKVIPGQESFVR